MRRGLFHPIERKQDAARLDVRTRGIGMARDGCVERLQRLLRLSQAKKIDAVIDTRIFIGRGVAGETDCGQQLAGSFGGMREPFERECKEPMGCGSVAECNRATQYVDRWLETVEQIEGPAVIEAGVLERGLAVAGRPESELGALIVLLRSVS